MTDIPAIPATKVCTKCGKEKTIDLYSRNCQNKDGRLNVCKKCQVDYAKEYRKKNRLTENKKRREMYAKLPDEKKKRKIQQATASYKRNRKKYNAIRKRNDDTDDYTDLHPLDERAIGFRSWAVITSTEYAKELTPWQIADTMENNEEASK